VNLPPTLALLAEILGEAGALKLAAAHGGTRIYVSRGPKGAVARVLGQELAERLVAEIGAGHLEIPYGPMGGAAGRRARMAKLLEQGVSAAKVARFVDVHARTVERTRAKLRRKPLPLFAAVTRKEKP